MLKVAGWQVKRHGCRLLKSFRTLVYLGCSKDISSNTGYFITQPIRIEYFKHVTELIHSRPISVQDFMGVGTTCKTITKSLPTSLEG